MDDINFKHLKDHAYYSELYDRMTIDECECWDSEVYDAHAKSDKKFDPTKPSRKLHGGLLADLALCFRKGDRYTKKEDVINRWMTNDQLRDEKVENAIEPKGVRCFHCSSSNMTCISRDLMHYANDKDEVLFMFQCGKCGKCRAYWENGNEWHPKPVLCEKCRTEMNSNSIRKGNVIETINSCPSCYHQKLDSFDLSLKEEVIEPDFEMKRRKYCLSTEEGKKYVFGTMHLESATRLMGEQEEREKNSELYEAIAKIRKLTVIEIKNLLDPILEKADYTKLEFEKPEITKDVIVGFSLQDAKSGRSQHDSVNEIQKLFKSSLEDTNWRLMSDGLSYRLGYLQGRIKGVEGEESLRKLVEKDLKK